jgi:AraC family transcriptional regulator
MKSDFGHVSSPLANLTLPSSIVHSSSGHSWHGLLLEQHRMPPGERPETVTERHVLLFRTTLFSCQYAWRGSLVRCTKKPGELTVIPAGYLPRMYSYTASEPILCAFELSFIESVVSEEDRQYDGELAFAPKFQDRAIQQLVTLLLAEIQGDMRSGTLLRHFLQPHSGGF